MSFLKAQSWTVSILRSFIDIVNKYTAFDKVYIIFLSMKFYILYF